MRNETRFTAVRYMDTHQRELTLSLKQLSPFLPGILSSLVHSKQPKLQSFDRSDLILLHSKQPKLQRVLAVLSAIGLNKREIIPDYRI